LEVRASATVAPLGKRLAVASVTLGTQDALTAPFLVSEGGNPPLEIRLTTDTGSITGVCERGTRIVGLQRKGGVTREIASVLGEGVYRFSDVAPGTYMLSASGAAQEVEVKAGETAVRNCGPQAVIVK
jgi:hypothetical protein